MSTFNRRPVGFLVWNPTRSLPTVQHDTLERAQAEAERLRAENPDEVFWVMSPLKPNQVSAAKAFSDGKAEGLAQAHAEIMRAEGYSDRASEKLHVTERRLRVLETFDAEAAQATVADCLCWFDGFMAAHAGADSRPQVPEREKLRRLNAALQERVRSARDDAQFSDEIPF